MSLSPFNKVQVSPSAAVRAQAERLRSLAHYWHARRQLVGFFVESVLFGIFCVLYPIAVWILLLFNGRPARKINQRLFAVATLMFVLSIAVRTKARTNSHAGTELMCRVVDGIQRLVTDTYKAFRAFVTFGDREAGGASVAYAIPTGWDVAGNAIYVTQTLVADAFMVRACYEVVCRGFPAQGMDLPLATC